MREGVGATSGGGNLTTIFKQLGVIFRTVGRFPHCVGRQGNKSSYPLCVYLSVSQYPAAADAVLWAWEEQEAKREGAMVRCGSVDLWVTTFGWPSPSAASVVSETVFRICRYIASVRGMTLAFSDPMVMRISHMASLLSSLSKEESQAELKCHMLMLYFFPIIVTEVYPSHGRSPNWVRFVHPHHHPLLTEESLIAFLAPLSPV